MKKSQMLGLNCICIISLILSGCSIETKRHVYTYTKKDGFSFATKSWYDKILPALNDGKMDIVYGYFCKRSKDKKTKNEVKQLVHLLKNKIKKYEVGELDLKYIESDEEQITEERYSYVMDNIYSTTGEKYILEIDFFETNTINPDLVGMTCIQLYDVTESKDVYPLEPQYTAGVDYVE